MTTPEGLHTNYLKKLCKQHRIVAYKVMFQGSRGAPDWMLLKNGHTLFMELKAKGGRLSPAQEEVIELMASEGGVEVWVCDSEKSIRAALNYGLGVDV